MSEKNTTMSSTTTSRGVKAVTAGTTAMAELPSELMKIVQNVKEIVNCPENEIYTVLKECNMDPDEAVQRLLSQDTFHKVISKRERKKEVKETPELRPQVDSSSSYRVPKNVGAESYITDSTWQTLSNSYERENSVYKKDLTYQRISEKPMNQLNESCSGAISHTHKGISVADGDARHSSAQPSPGSKILTSGADGRASVAEILRMGTPASNSLSHNVSHPQEVPLPPNCISNSGKKINHPVNHTFIAGHQISDDWFVVRQPGAESSPSDTEIYSDHSTSHSGRSNLSATGQPEFTSQTSEDSPHRNLTEHIGSTTELSRQTVMEVARDLSHLDIEARKDVSSGQAGSFTFMHREGGGSKLLPPGCSTPFDRNVRNAKNLSSPKKDTKLPPKEVECHLVIPAHLQVSSADCSHLTFGTFNSGNGLGLSGLISSNPIESELTEATSAAIDWSSSSHISTRNLAHCYPHKVSADSKTNDSNRRSQPELIKPSVIESTQQQPYILPGRDFENKQEPPLPPSYLHSTAYKKDASSFSSRMGLKQNAFSTHQSNNGIDAGLTYPPDYPLKQDAFSVPKTYSQSSRPMEQNFAGMNGYPIQPQAYSNLHSEASLRRGKQQAPNINDYPVQPQSCVDSGVQDYLQKVSFLNSLSPQYGHPYDDPISDSKLRVLRKVTNLQPKPSSKHVYGDISNTGYGDGNQSLYSQQGERSAFSGHGYSAGTQSPVPNNMHYGVQAPQEPLAGYQQTRQSWPQRQLRESQDYANYLHQQSRISQDQVQRRATDFTSYGSQGLPPTQSRQGLPPTQSRQFWHPNF